MKRDIMKCSVQRHPRPYFLSSPTATSSSCNPSALSQWWAASVNQLHTAHTLQKPGCFHRTVLSLSLWQQILCSCRRHSLLKRSRSWPWLRRRFSPSHYYTYFPLFLSLGAITFASASTSHLEFSISFSG